MSFARTLVVSIGLAVLGGAAPAQREWIVDDDGGAGVDFRDLQAAFDAAAPGDRIVVRAGGYLPAVTNKGLRVFGEGTLTYRLWLPYPPQMELIGVRDLPADQTFTISGVTIVDVPAGRRVIRLERNRGRVHLDGVLLNSGAIGQNAYFTLPALTVLDCAHVSLTNSRLYGQPGLGCWGSRVMVTGCELSGRKAGSMSHVHWGSQPAVLALRSQLVLARTSARGGDGAGSFAASPALDLTSCEVVLRGDAASLIEAGALGMEPGMAAVIAWSGSLVVDPTLRLVARGSAPAVLTDGRLVSVRLASLAASEAARGGELRAEVFGDPGFLVLLLLGQPAGPLAMPFGDLWLDPLAMTVLDAGIIGAGGSRRAAARLPDAPALRGRPVGVQAVAGPASALSLTNAGIVTIR